MSPLANADVIAALDADIAARESALERLREARRILAGMDAPAPRTTKSVPPTTKPVVVDASAAGDAVAAIAGHLGKQREPAKFADVRRALKLPQSTANRALQQLLSQKRVVRDGWYVGTPEVMSAAADAEED